MDQKCFAWRTSTSMKKFGRNQGNPRHYTKFYFQLYPTFPKEALGMFYRNKLSVGETIFHYKTSLIIINLIHFRNSIFLTFKIQPHFRRKTSQKNIHYVNRITVDCQNNVFERSAVALDGSEVVKIKQRIQNSRTRWTVKVAVSRRVDDMHIWFRHKLNLQLISSQIVEEIKFHTPLAHSWM